MITIVQCDSYWHLSVKCLSEKAGLEMNSFLNFQQMARSDVTTLYQLMLLPLGTFMENSLLKTGIHVL